MNYKDVGGKEKHALMPSGRDGTRNIFYSYNQLTTSMALLVVKVGDVVLIMNEKSPRLLWVLAVIEETFMGRDDHICLCLLRKSDGRKARKAVQHQRGYASGYASGTNEHFLDQLYLSALVHFFLNFFLLKAQLAEGFSKCQRVEHFYKDLNGKTGQGFKAASKHCHRIATAMISQSWSIGQKRKFLHFRNDSLTLYHSSWLLWNGKLKAIISTIQWLITVYLIPGSLTHGTGFNVPVWTLLTHCSCSMTAHSCNGPSMTKYWTEKKVPACLQWFAHPTIFQVTFLIAKKWFVTFKFITRPWDNLKIVLWLEAETYK